MPVADTACAPFTDGQWLFSHNGRVVDWPESVVDVAKTLPVALPSAWAQPLVYLSGLAELAGGAALLAPMPAPWWRRAGGWFVAALLVVVFPANVQMALDSPNLLTLGRLPLQVPLVWAAVRVARQRDGAADPWPWNSTSGMGLAKR
jgi:uncharacterized membrane protein